jgi:hypothetical protein
MLIKLKWGRKLKTSNFVKHSSLDLDTTEKWLVQLWDKYNWNKEEENSLFELLISLLIVYKMSKNPQLLVTINDIITYIDENFKQKINNINPFLYTKTIKLLENRNELISFSIVLEKHKYKLIKHLSNLPEETNYDIRIIELKNMYHLVTNEDLFDYISNKIICDENFLLLDNELIKEQLHLWSMCSAYGMIEIPTQFKYQLNNLKILLPGIMLAECQRYQINLVSLILRTMKYLRFDKEEITEGLEFLFFQQRSNGAFGFLNPFSDPLSQINNIDLDYHLPLTLEVLYTIEQTLDKEGLQI